MALLTDPKQLQPTELGPSHAPEKPLAAVDFSLASSMPRPTEKHFQRLLTEPDYLADHIRQSSEVFAAAAPFSPEPSSGYKASLNRAYIGNLMNIPESDLDDVTYEILRDGYVMAFGDSPSPFGTTEEQANNVITKQVKRQVLLSKARVEMQGGIILEHLRDGPSEGFTQDRAEAYAQKHQAAYEGRDEGVREYLANADDIRTQLAPYRDKVKSTLETLMGFAGVGDRPPAGRKEVAALADGLRQIPREKRQMVYQYVRLAAGAMGLGDDKSFWQQLGESVGRGVSDMAWNVGSTIKEEDLLRMRRSLDHRNVYVTKGAATGRLIPTISLPTDNDTVAWEQFRARRPTAEEKEEIRTRLEARLGLIEVQRELFALADEEVDPIRPKADGVLGMVEGGLYGFGRSAPTLALGLVPGAGMGLVGAATYGAEYNRFRLKYPDLDPEAAGNMAAVSSLLQTPLEMLQIKGLAGRLPVTAAFIDGLADASVPLSLRLGAAYTGHLAEQSAQEIVQNAISLSVEGLSAGLREDMPEFDFEETFRGFLEEAPAMVFQVLPMALIGGSVASYRQIRNGARYTADIANLRQSGFSDFAARKIAAEPDEARREGLIRELWPTRTEADIAAGIRMAQGTEAGERPRPFDPENRNGPLIEVGGWGGHEVREADARTDMEPVGMKDLALRFSKSENRRSPREIGDALIELSRDERTRIYGPNPTAKDLPTILQTLAPEQAGRITISEGAGSHGKGYTFEDSQGGKIYLIQDYENAARVNSEGAKADGTPIYQSIYAWAHNNGIQIDEDHAMLSDGIYRRDSQMLSSALRFGTTRHMTVGEHSGLVDQWIRNDDSPAATAHNIGLLALKEAEIVMKRLSDIEGLRYDIPNQAFYDGEYRIPDAETPTYFWGRIRAVDKDFSQRVGPATLRRALAVIAAEGAGGTGRVRLVGEAAEAPRPLHGLLYAKDEGGEFAADRGRGPGEGGEPAEVSGEAGRGGSGQELKAGPERTAQVRQWTEEIRAGWGSRLDVVVHDSAEGITDADLRKAVARGGRRVEAFFDPQDGRIHLLANRVASKVDAERLLRHEGIHWAINGKLGKEYASILDGVRKLISDTEWKKIGKDYPNASDRVRVEEYLAYLGQNNPKATAWQSFVYEFKQAVRTIFGKEFAVTDADVLAFLAKANRRVEGGNRNPSGSSGGGILYSKAHDDILREFEANPQNPDARAFKRWFESEFRDIQKGLRPEDERRINQILDRLPPYQSSRPIYRGVPFLNEKDRQAFLRKFSGKYWENDMPFMSASKEGRPAINHVETSNYPVLMLILRNETGRDVEPLSRQLSKFGGQKEILYSRGAKFEVKERGKSDRLGKTFYTIQLVEVP